MVSSKTSTTNLDLTIVSSATTSQTPIQHTQFLTTKPTTFDESMATTTTIILASVVLLPIGTIVAIVFGILLFLLATAVVVFCIYHHRRSVVAAENTGFVEYRKFVSFFYSNFKNTYAIQHYTLALLCRLQLNKTKQPRLNWVVLL